MARRIYAIYRPGDLTVTDLVAVDPPESLADFMVERDYIGRGVPLLKRVMGLPGQKVCRVHRSITVDGVELGAALDRDRSGRELPVWNGCRRIGGNEIFLMNVDVRDSLDSRYFGPIPISTVIGRATPIYTDEVGDGRFVWRAATRWSPRFRRAWRAPTFTQNPASSARRLRQLARRPIRLHR